MSICLSIYIVVDLNRYLAMSNYKIMYVDLCQPNHFIDKSQCSKENEKPLSASREEGRRLKSQFPLII